MHSAHGATRSEGTFFQGEAALRQAFCYRTQVSHMPHTCMKREECKCVPHDVIRHYYTDTVLVKEIMIVAHLDPYKATVALEGDLS